MFSRLGHTLCVFGIPMKPTGWICFLLAATVLAVYAQVVNHDFLYFDDVIDVYGNPYVAQGLTLESFSWAMTTIEHANWQPLTRLSHILVADCFGNGPAPGLMVNVLLHLINSLLLFGVLRQMTGSMWKSAVVAALFSLHPLRVESVAWLTERKDLLSGLFWMLAIGAYSRYARSSRTGSYLVSLLFFIMGLMSKPMVITLPVVLLFLDYWPLNRLQPETIFKRIREKLPFFVCSAASAMVTVFAHREAGALLSLEQTSMGHRIANAAISYTVYIRRHFWPSDLAAFYSMPERFPVWETAGAALVIIVLSALSLAAVRHRFLIVGWLWFLVTLLPVIGLVNWGFHQMADRFTYLPSIGLLIALVWGMGAIARSWPNGKPVLAAAAAAAVVALASASWHQTRYWKDFIALFTHAVTVSPNNWWGLLALGGAHAHEGRPGEAIRYYSRALALRPDHAPGHLMMARALVRVGRQEPALRHLEKALHIDTSLTAAWIDKGNLLAEQGVVDEAERCYRRALALDPSSTGALLPLGNLLLRTGRPAEAAVHLARCIQADPSAFAAHNSLGVALYRMGHTGEAVAHMKRAVQIRPGYVAAKENLRSIGAE